MRTSRITSYTVAQVHRAAGGQITCDAVWRKVRHNIILKREAEEPGDAGEPLMAVLVEKRGLGRVSKIGA